MEYLLDRINMMYRMKEVPKDKQSAFNWGLPRLIPKDKQSGFNWGVNPCPRKTGL